MSFTVALAIVLVSALAFENGRHIAICGIVFMGILIIAAMCTG